MKVHWARFERHGIEARGEAKEVYAAACGAGEGLPSVRRPRQMPAKHLVTCKRCQGIIRRIEREAAESRLAELAREGSEG